MLVTVTSLCQTSTYFKLKNSLTLSLSSSVFKMIIAYRNQNIATYETLNLNKEPSQIPSSVSILTSCERTLRNEVMDVPRQKQQSKLNIHTTLILVDKCKLHEYFNGKRLKVVKGTVFLSTMMIRLSNLSYSNF